MRHITSIKNQTSNSTRDITDIKTMRVQLYTHKSDNVDEIDQFLKKAHKLLKFTQYEIGNLNNPIIKFPIKNFSFIILKLLKMKSPHPDGFIREFYPTFIKEHQCCILFQKT